jgi:AcrR family transcriptional regulator
MARRSDHTREEIRQLALDACGDIIDQAGLEGLSVRKIAAGIGYTPGTLYQVFENLDDILMQTLGGRLDAVYDAMTSAVGRARTPETRLHRLAQAYLDDVMGHERRWNAIYAHRLPEGVETPAWYLEKIDRIFALIGEQIGALLPGKTAATRQAISRALWSCVHGASVLQLQGKFAGSEKEFRDSVETGIRLILKGAVS